MHPSEIALDNFKFDFYIKSNCIDALELALEDFIYWKLDAEDRMENSWTLWE